MDFGISFFVDVYKSKWSGFFQWYEISHGMILWAVPAVDVITRHVLFYVPVPAIHNLREVALRSVPFWRMMHMDVKWIWTRLEFFSGILPPTLALEGRKICVIKQYHSGTYYHKNETARRSLHTDNQQFENRGFSFGVYSRWYC